MQNELEIKLAQINKEIAELEGDTEMETAYYFGRKWTLIKMKEWLEGMIANYCE
jgi:hypothetical protein